MTNIRGYEVVKFLRASSGDKAVQIHDNKIGKIRDSDAIALGLAAVVTVVALIVAGIVSVLMHGQ